MNPSQVSILSSRKLLQILLLCCAAILLIKGALALTSAQSTTGEERKFNNKEFRDMPVRVRKVKNLQSETWPKDLEIEIENVSNRPIYFVNAALIFPDDPAPNGASGILLQYGNVKNLDIRRIAEAEDEHLDPGKTVTLVVSNMYKKGLLAKQKRTPNNLKRLDFSLDIVNFGDGTGFVAGEFLDFRKKSAFSPPQEDAKKKR